MLEARIQPRLSILVEIPTVSVCVCQISDIWSASRAFGDERILDGSSIEGIKALFR